jgi:hypothetical protein
MPTTTISPHARIGALVGVFLTALAGTAFFLLHGHSHPATVTIPVTHHHPAPSKHVTVVRPTVNPLLPAAVHVALENHRRVVVAFYNPDSPVDMLTVAETRAGAATGGVGFVAVNLLNDSAAGPLTALLPAGTILPNPGFLIYGRPGTILYRSDGYLSRTAVAQAVRDAP